MVKVRRVQLRKVATWLASLCAAMFFAVSMFSPFAAFAEPPGADTTVDAIRTSAVWPVLWWCFGWPILFSRAPGGLAPAWRVFWTLGCALLVLHVAVAFHLGHAWSHATAWEHTRRVGGYGDGIYANYAFVLIWVADVTWSWASFRSYLSRPNWLRWGILLFQAFIVFNAAVVFAPTWNTRILFLLMFLASSVCLWVIWLASSRSPQ